MLRKWQQTWLFFLQRCSSRYLGQTLGSCVFTCCLQAVPLLCGPCIGLCCSCPLSSLAPIVRTLNTGEPLALCSIPPPQTQHARCPISFLERMPKPARGPSSPRKKLTPRCFVIKRGDAAQLHFRTFRSQKPKQPQPRH